MSNVFEWIKSITYTKENLLETNEIKEYNPYITNKSLSYHLDCLLFANEMNVRPFLDKDMQYTFLLNGIRKNRRYSKWEKKYNNDDIKYIKKYYNYSDEKAYQVIDLLSKEEIAYIKNTYENINL
jgi:hypothetical protein